MCILGSFKNSNLEFCKITEPIVSKCLCIWIICPLFEDQHNVVETALD